MTVHEYDNNVCHQYSGFDTAGLHFLSIKYSWWHKIFTTASAFCCISLIKRELSRMRGETMDLFDDCLILISRKLAEKGQVVTS